MHSWIQQGHGRSPEVAWTFHVDGAVVALRHGRESGETMIADDLGGIYRLNRAGELLEVTRLSSPAIALDWDDIGGHGVAIRADQIVTRLNAQLKSVWEIEISDTASCACIDAFGRYHAIGMIDGGVMVMDDKPRRIATWRNTVPAAELAFSPEQPHLISMAAHDLLACHTVQGYGEWNVRPSTHVGNLALAPGGQTIYLAGHTHGVLRFDLRNGASATPLLVPGTPAQVACNYRGDCVLVATVEQQVLVMDQDREIRWGAEAPVPILRLAVTAVGDRGIIALANQEVLAVKIDS